ncbi:hypothetical protein [Saccharopolyspora sp. ASAGF58]|uniref:hypothetical protein n=1 Tax=Saccharopolyspora sp. ASAGF58 TaxID=2719023 RepID=UPI0014402370|nr:hypothetical protein [Saccharopolyspora sp. ASAGF58]QIZ36822.1 hypothetical protein FDZ84_21895 [Saccharopolyspora sp. ASAGF58]
MGLRRAAPGLRYDEPGQHRVVLLQPAFGEFVQDPDLVRALVRREALPAEGERFRRANVHPQRFPDTLVLAG